MKKTELITLVKKAKISSRIISTISTYIKNRALETIALSLAESKQKILKENQKDIIKAKKTGTSYALIDRLTLNENRINGMITGLKEISKLEDPIGTVLLEWTTPNGLKIKKVRVALGVICMIYESRPNVTVESTALCLKSGNAVILRGGSISLNSNRVLTKIIKDSLLKAGIPSDAVCFVDSTKRDFIHQLIKMDKFIDLVIPRGSEKMINQIRKNAVVPVLAHGKGLCHTYIDKSANIDMAINVSYNAKVQRPGVCNAMETLLVHRDIAKIVLPKLFDLYTKAGVELRGCKETKKILPYIKKATEDDWTTEYLDLILSIKIVNSTEEAIEHINKYGSGHSETIITEDIQEAEKFVKLVDASAVFHNASTRLHDGSVFGLGAEIGISTQKLHARGTMGLNELTTTKYIVQGTGQIRE